MRLSLSAISQTTGLLLIAVKALHVSSYSGARRHCVPVIAGKIVAARHSPFASTLCHTPTLLLQPAYLLLSPEQSAAIYSVDSLSCRSLKLASSGPHECPSGELERNTSGHILLILGLTGYQAERSRSCWLHISALSPALCCSPASLDHAGGEGIQLHPTDVCWEKGLALCQGGEDVPDCPCVTVSVPGSVGCSSDNLGCGKSSCNRVLGSSVLLLRK